MNHRRPLVAAALCAALFAAPALAQESGAMLRVDSGTAMVSNGGEFVTAPSGTPVAAGDRVMLAEGSRAALVYPDGCTQALGAAGVHAVPVVCTPVAAGATAATRTAGAVGTDVAGLGIVTGIAVGGAALLDSMDEQGYVPPPPVSR